MALEYIFVYRLCLELVGKFWTVYCNFKSLFALPWTQGVRWPARTEAK